MSAMLDTWINAQTLPRGIGVDCVNIPELRALNERTNGAFRLGTFTEAEQTEAENAPDPWVYLAGRFAAKEAVFKALSPLLPKSTFDFRRVETLRQPDGSPRVSRSPWLLSLMKQAEVDDILLSITNETPYAIAFSQAIQIRKSKECMP